MGHLLGPFAWKGFRVGFRDSVYFEGGPPSKMDCSRVVMGLVRVFNVLPSPRSLKVAPNPKP